jgi:hypothetical protein
MIPKLFQKNHEHDVYFLENLLHDAVFFFAFAETHCPIVSLLGTITIL